MNRCLVSSAVILLVACASTLTATAATPPVYRGSIEQRNAPIHTEAQLADHLRTLSPTSPLADLSATARERFIESLRFNDAGLVSYNYQDIEKELTATQAYRLLALLGAQRTIGLLGNVKVETVDDASIMADAARLPPDDHQGYACSGRATCTTSMHSICMTGC